MNLLTDLSPQQFHKGSLFSIVLILSSSPADSCPASSSSTKVSRSGRVIKPPLEYWKGGRVILDAHMNVTIHECYDTSICSPVSLAQMDLSVSKIRSDCVQTTDILDDSLSFSQDVTTTVSTKASQKTPHVFPPISKGKDTALLLHYCEISYELQTVLCVSRP